MSMTLGETARILADISTFAALPSALSLAWWWMRSWRRSTERSLSIVSSLSESWERHLTLLRSDSTTRTSELDRQTDRIKDLEAKLLTKSAWDYRTAAPRAERKERERPDPNAPGRTYDPVFGFVGKTRELVGDESEGE